MKLFDRNFLISRKLLSTFSIVLIVTSYSQGSVLKVVMSSPSPRTSSFNPKKCLPLFSNTEFRETTWTESVDSGHLAITTFANFGPNGKPLHKVIPEILLRTYEKDPRMTPERTQIVREKAKTLDEARTTWLGFLKENESGHVDRQNLNAEFSGLRIYDGSTRPLFNNQPSQNVRESTKDLPAEKELRESGFILPERIIEALTGKPAHIMELGLVNVRKGYEHAMKTLMGTLAREVIDAHYNQNHYNTQSRLDVLAQNDLVIYVVAPKVNARLNQSLGFEYVYSAATRKPVQTERGLFLMKMRATDLVKNYSDFAFKPIVKGEKREDPKTEEQEYRDDITSYFDSMKKDAAKLKTEDDLIIASYRVSKLHEILFSSRVEELVDHPALQYLKEPGGRMEEAIALNRYQIFFEAYYVLAHAFISQKIPKDKKHLFDKYILPYEKMVHAWTSHKHLYELFREENAAGRLVQVWTREMIQEFEQTNARGLKEYKGMDFLQEWF